MKLESCPFCFNEDLQYNDEYQEIRCSKCGMNVYFSGNEHYLLSTEDDIDEIKNNMKEYTIEQYNNRKHFLTNDVINFIKTKYPQYIIIGSGFTDSPESIRIKILGVEEDNCNKIDFECYDLIWKNKELNKYFYLIHISVKNINVTVENYKDEVQNYFKTLDKEALSLIDKNLLEIISKKD